MSLVLSEAVGYLVNRAALCMVNNLTRNFSQAGFDVTPEQWRVLLSLWERDGQNQQELCAATGKSKTSITRLIHGMERRNLVLRVPDRQDRRHNLVYLTNLGKSLEHQLREVTLLTRDQALNGIAPADLETCKRVLRQIIANLDGRE